MQVEVSEGPHGPAHGHPALVGQLVSHAALSQERKIVKEGSPGKAQSNREPG